MWIRIGVVLPRIMATESSELHPYENQLHRSLQVTMEDSECVGMTWLAGWFSKSPLKKIRKSEKAVA
jgi:hypothetical protein